MQVLKLIVNGKKVLLHAGNREFRKSMQRWPSGDWKPYGFSPVKNHHPSAGKP